MKRAWQGPRPGRRQLLAFGGVAGPLVFVTLVVLGGILSDGYSHSSQAISELGGEGADHAWLQNLNFIVLGVLLLGFAWALAGLSGAVVGAVLVAIFAISAAILNGLLPCDLDCEGQTTVGLLHNVTGVAGIVAAIAGMWALSRQWRQEPHWRSHARLTRIAAVVTLAGLIGFMVTRALDGGGDRRAPAAGIRGRPPGLDRADRPAAVADGAARTRRRWRDSVCRAQRLGLLTRRGCADDERRRKRSGIAPAFRPLGGSGRRHVRAPVRTGPSAVDQ